MMFYFIFSVITLSGGRTAPMFPSKDRYTDRNGTSLEEHDYDDYKYKCERIKPFLMVCENFELLAALFGVFKFCLFVYFFFFFVL